ncbi:hypothetical protein [Roseitalea sp. MMSF_3516]|uniref:hypothetical protein n=1 Tax=Roseitalea sp. MMSF_3516 TaxID=3046719 RepID=UPI00273D15A4|nr:hypothetical protein [Roseitalea sp. MMSF_3516]
MGFIGNRPCRRDRLCPAHSPLLLRIRPRRRARRDDLLPGLRIVGFERRITIAFTIDDDTVTFLRFFYGGQDWEDAFE